MPRAAKPTRLPGGGGISMATEPPGPAFLLAETLELARQGLVAALGADELARHGATGAALPVDEALAVVAARLGEA
jgi:hypothetical protein